MARNKVVYFGETLMDITDTTSVASDVAKGTYFYTSDGNRQEGTHVDSVTSVNNKTGDVVLDATDVGALPDTTTIPTKTSDLTNDSGYITSSPVTSVNNQTGDVVLSASDVGALPDTTAIPTKTSDLTNDSNFMDGMTILSYGKSTWNDFITVYQARHVVYCRASSNSNPASGSQTRLAFMAYVNNADNPTEVEFQYYRSVNGHNVTQQGDQVYVYKLNKTNGWSVTVRECYTRIVAGTGITATYKNGVLTIALAETE